MNTLIGGLLVVSLMSRPSMFQVNDDFYEKVFPKTQVIRVSKKEEHELDIDTIDDTLNTIDKNSRKINSLLKEKALFFGKIQAKMDLFSFSKIRLSDEQMKNFSDFTRFTQMENIYLTQVLKTYEKDKDLKEVKKELLKSGADLNFIQRELTRIVGYQLEAISSLLAMIGCANAILAII